MWKSTFSTALVALTLAAAAGQACADDTDMLREAHDRAAIQSLMWRYTRALDTMDIDTYLSLFTEDGQLVAGDNAIVGREAIGRLMHVIADGTAKRKAAGEAVPASYHLSSNVTIEFDGPDQARLYAYWTAVNAPVEQGGAPSIDSVGWERNELVRVDGQWRIKVRNTAPNDE